MGKESISEGDTSVRIQRASKPRAEKMGERGRFCKEYASHRGSEQWIGTIQMVQVFGRSPNHHDEPIEISGNGRSLER